MQAARHALAGARRQLTVDLGPAADSIRAEGCSEMQGFLFSRPVPAHEIEQHFLGDQDYGITIAA